MPNAVTSTGIVVNTQSDIIAYLTAQYKLIYGNDIVLTPDSPDGQWMMSIVQVAIDNLDLIVQVFNGFDPDNALGRVLDQRVAINGIQRQAGTFTTTNITLTITGSVNLYGLDQTAQSVYTVADNAGNKWELISTHLAAVTGAYLFQSAVPGAITPTVNTITVPVTVILGITAINNPTTYATLGINEESDAALKIRRQISVSLASQGYLAGLLAALENISGLTFAFVYENNTDSTDAQGVPSHSIWVIVAGTGAALDIATAIYQKRNAGCGMYGSQTYIITQVDGSSFAVFWDNVTPVNLFIKFTLTPLKNTSDGGSIPNIAAIRAGLVTSFVPGVAEEVNINGLATDVQAIDPTVLVTSAGFSLASGGAYTNTLTPVLKNNQFAVSAPNIIVLPMIISSPTSTLRVVGLAVVVTDTVVNLGTITFSTLGGYGTDHSGSVPHLTYSIQSGSGSIVSATGVFTANGTGTTVVLVTDALSNTATVSVVVT